MSVKGQDERRTVEWVATSLEAMASKLSLPHGPEFLERAVDDLLARATDVRAVGAALAGSEARERELEAERDDARFLAEARGREKDRHRREKLASEAREAVLVEALKELVRLKDLKDAAKVEEGEGFDRRHPRITWTPEEKVQAWEKARTALAGVVEVEPDGRAQR